MKLWNSISDLSLVWLVADWRLSTPVNNGLWWSELAIPSAKIIYKNITLPWCELYQFWRFYDNIMKIKINDDIRIVSYTAHISWFAWCRIENKILTILYLGTNWSKFSYLNGPTQRENLPGAGNDEYSLLDLYSWFFWLLVPYSKNLLLNRVASNSNKTIDGPKLSIIWCRQYLVMVF